MIIINRVSSITSGQIVSPLPEPFHPSWREAAIQGTDISELTGTTHPQECHFQLELALWYDPLANLLHQSPLPPLTSKVPSGWSLSWISFLDSTVASNNSNPSTKKRSDPLKYILTIKQDKPGGIVVYPLPGAIYRRPEDSSNSQERGSSLLSFKMRLVLEKEGKFNVVLPVSEHQNLIGFSTRHNLGWRISVKTKRLEVRDKEGRVILPPQLRRFQSVPCFEAMTDLPRRIIEKAQTYPPPKEISLQ